MGKMCNSIAAAVANDADEQPMDSAQCQSDQCGPSRRVKRHCSVSQCSDGTTMAGTLVRTAQHRPSLPLVLCVVGLGLASAVSSTSDNSGPQSWQPARAVLHVAHHSSHSKHQHQQNQEQQQQQVQLDRSSGNHYRSLLTRITPLADDNRISSGPCRHRPAGHYWPSEHHHQLRWSNEPHHLSALKPITREEKAYEREQAESVGSEESVQQHSSTSSLSSSPTDDKVVNNGKQQQQRQLHRKHHKRQTTHELVSTDTVALYYTIQTA